MSLPDVLLLIALSITLLFHFALLKWLILPRLSPRAAQLVFLLTAVEITLVGLNALIWGAIPEDHNWEEFLEWFLNLSREFALGATFSSAQLIAAGIIGFLMGAALPGRIWKRGYWFMLAFGLVFLGLDEYYLIHETVQQTTGYWQLIYATAGLGVGALSLLAYWYSFRDQLDLFALLFAGLAIMGVSGIALDFVAQEIICSQPALGIGCHRFFVIEEYLEMAGGTILLAAFISYTSREFKPSQWRKGRRVLAGIIALYTFWLLGNLWIFPSFEAQWLATPVDAQYFNNELSLVGYRLSQRSIRPGEEVFVALYWRPESWLRREYIQSIHALERPEFRSIAQYDTPRNDRYPTDAWIPGLVVREVLPLKFPQDIDAPASYAISLEFWHRDERLAVIHTNRPRLNDSVILLDRVSILSEAPQNEPPVQAAYRFAHQFTLYGYDLPETANIGDEVSLAFWWETAAEVDVQLTQFAHLFHVQSDVFYTFDRLPFNGRFPTEDWIGGIQMVDEWRAQLPVDMPEGDYRVYTGLYHSSTIEREPVADTDGQPVENYSIFLGVISLDADP